MIICLCNGVTDRDILCAIDRGLDTVDALSDELNVTTICGSCQHEIESLIQKFVKPSNHYLKFVKID
jgi:bacterioferritin-associated ferredoxin